MGGGLMQLVAYGAQDIYLTGNPQITFFKVVYRRHTNFSMEAIQQTWNGSDGVSGSPSAGRCTATISRNGDLVYRMYLQVVGTTDGDHINPMASAITDVELEIGGQKIDKHTGQWMNTWAHLTQLNPGGHVGESVSTTETGTLFQNMSGMGGCFVKTAAADTRYWTPLQFWFCRNPGLALPLIALQYHEVKVILNHDFKNTGNNTWNEVTENTLWCDYIYLDTDERRRFAQVSHEYLIEQVQEQTFANSALDSNGHVELNFNHPVKELIFTSDNIGATPIAATDATLSLKLNGHDRFAARNWRYFARTQIWEHHTGCGGLTAVQMNAGKMNGSIGVYSFALKPEEHQPSGTCNFSRIDNAQLIGGGTNHMTNVYAVNYNVLRIMSGMGGLAYSN